MKKHRIFLDHHSVSKCFVIFTFQVAKVSKLLLELEKGNIHQFKGKRLDEIQFDLEGK
jgi:hypothetical protein